MKKTSIFFLSIIFTCQSFASEIWVTTPKLTSREQIDEITEKYRSQIKNGDFVSSFDFLIGHPVTQSEMAVILDLDSMARSDALNGIFEKAFIQYLKLEERLKKLPNVSGLEKIELSTRVSLAHMATMLRNPKAEIFWKEAHAWAPGAVLSPEEFSPAVILQFSKSTNNKKTIVEIKSSEEAFVFVDGLRLKKPHRVSLEAGHHQASVLTPGASWAFKNFEVKQNDKPIELSILPTPFAKGSCQSPQFIGRSLPPKTKLLVSFDEDCARIYSEKTWHTVEGAKLGENNKIAVLSDDLKPSEDGAGISSLSGKESQKKSFLSGITKSGWFWAGVGAAVVGAAVIISSSSQTTTVPSHTAQ